MGGIRDQVWGETKLATWKAFLREAAEMNLSTKADHILESGDRRTCRPKEVPEEVHYAVRHRGPCDEPDAPAVDAQWQGKPLAFFELDAWSHLMSPSACDPPKLSAC